MRLLAVLLISAALHAQPLLQLADPEAQALLGVEWSRIARSEYISQARARFSSELGQVKGLEFLEQLDRFVLSAAPGKNGRPTSVLLLIEGRFQASELRKLMLQQKATVQRFRGVEILRQPQGEQMEFAILSDRTLLAGDRSSLLAAIERVQSGSAQLPANSIYQRALALSARSDIWGVASPEIFSAMGLKEFSAEIQAAAGKDPIAAEFLKALKNIETGGPIEFGVTMDELQRSVPKQVVAVTQPPSPPQKGKIKIYGLDEGVREVELK
jgi:hypothetical protein